jgi:hypothetical protein
VAGKRHQIIDAIAHSLKENDMFKNRKDRMELPQNVIESELPEQKAPIQQKTNDLWSQLGQSFMKESIPNLDYKPEAP